MATPKKQIVQDADFTDSESISLADLESLRASQDQNHDDDMPDDMAFQSIVNELGLSDQSGKVNVYKLEKGNYQDQIFLFECMPTEFNLTMLQNPAYHVDGFHKFKVILRNSKNIVKAKVLAVMPNAKLFEKTDLAVIPQNNNSDVLNAIKAMSDNTNALIAAIVNRPAPEQKSTLDVLKEMQLMRDIMGGNTAPAQATQSPLEVLELAKELALAMNPEANTGIMSVMGKMLEKYGEPVMNAISAAQQNKADQLKITQIQQEQIKMPASPHGITPNPAPVKVAEVPQVNKNIEGDNMNFMLKMYLDQLIQQAKRNADVALYADVVLDQVGDTIYPLIESDDWFMRLTAITPEAANYKEWFTNLRTELLSDDGSDDDENDLITGTSETLTNDVNSDIKDVTELLEINPHALGNAYES